MSGLRDYDVLMRLPAGRTCSDCLFFRRCKALGYTHDDRTQCDFWPRRYHQIAIRAEPCQPS